MIVNRFFEFFVFQNISIPCFLQGEAIIWQLRVNGNYVEKKEYKYPEKWNTWSEEDKEIVIDAIKDATKYSEELETIINMTSDFDGNEITEFLKWWFYGSGRRKYVPESDILIELGETVNLTMKFTYIALRNSSN